MEYKNTYQNIDTTLSFKISGQINTLEYNKVIEIIDYYLKKVNTIYDILDIITKLSNLFYLFKDNLIVINFNNNEDNFNLKYKDNKLLYYHKIRVINNKRLEIIYQDNKFRIIEPDINLYKQGFEEEDYKEVANTILNEIATYESLKEIKENKLEIAFKIKEFSTLYKLFYKEQNSLLDSKIYLKATCMYFIIEDILGIYYFQDGYYLNKGIIANFNIDTLVYNYLNLININIDYVEVDKRVEIIGNKIREYFKGNLNKLLEFTSYLYHRELNLEKENLEFENLLNYIYYGLESYKRNEKRKRYLKRFN